MIKDDLIGKITAHSARIGVIRLGYVGLPLVLRFCEEKFRVIGFDVDQAKIDKLNAGESYIKHIAADRFQALIRSHQFEATVDFDRLAEADCIIICVPTPLTEKKDPDLQYVEKTAEAIAPRLRKGQLISLESTTYPGTTEEILLSLFKKTGLEVGKDYFLVFSPEREDPGNPNFTTRTIPKVVGGVTPECLEVGRALYSQVIDKVVTVSSTRAAELVKLLENIYRCVNIALVNELKLLTDRMDIDIWEVIDAASSKPFGFTPFYPGPGLGGHCIPIDPFYLSWKAKEFDPPLVDVATFVEDMDVVLIEEFTLLDAEGWIRACERCSNDATIPFDYILDARTGLDPARTDYLMCRRAVCPSCGSKLTEKSLVLA